jgi:predicted RNA-binding protein (virulence factor B family)
MHSLKGKPVSSEKPIILDTVEEHVFSEGQEVALIIKTETDLGYKAIVNGKYWGVLYYNEVFHDLFKNQELKGYIKKIRADGRIDLSLYKLGSRGSIDIGENILKILEEAGGFLDITDKTPAPEIYALFGVSKKKFKMALGGLYKKRLIITEEKGITLLLTKK